MKEFILDTELEDIDLSGNANDEIRFLESITKNRFSRWNNKEQKYESDDLTGKYRSYLYGDVYHANYLRYLEVCYNYHKGYVISPDILWNIVLNELATEVKKHTELYRFLFTDSTEKKDVIVMGSDPFELDMNQIIDQLRGLVPSDVDAFIPEFSTTEPAATHAHYCAFADMVSPYYNYMMLLCGFPKVKVEGEIADWTLFLESLNKLQNLFTENSVSNYLSGVQEHISTICLYLDTETYNNDFFQNIFTLQRCGSGSQVELNGWITDFFIERPRVPYIENFSAGYAKVDYKVIPTNEELSLFSGLFCSEEIDGYLVPRFSRLSCVRELIKEKEEVW